MSFASTTERFWVYTIEHAKSAPRNEAEQADEITGPVSKGVWSGFTVDQIADHLGIQGGNISFAFEDPVYFEVDAEWSTEGKTTTRRILHSKSPDTMFDVFIKVENTSPGGADPNQVQGKAFIRIQKTGPGTMNGLSSRGAGMNYHWETEGARTQYERSWNRPDMDVSLGERVLLYAVADANAPDRNFYKVYMRFTEEAPAAEE